MHQKTFVPKSLFRLYISYMRKSGANEETIERLLWQYHCLYEIDNTSEIEARAALPIFDYQALSQPLSNWQRHFISENDLYGNAYVLKQHFPVDEYTRIEHGVYFGEHVPPRNSDTITRTIITFSEYRKKILQQYIDKPIITTGSYIYYANMLLNPTQFASLKSSLGRVLLVFPSHSIAGVHVQFDMQKWIEYIESIRQDFDTVLVCLYFKDVTQHAEQYQSHGYRIVTAGHIQDYHFLERLKTIISLSDMTVSNNLGTHIGYCVSLGKPHHIFHSQIDYVAHHNKSGARAAEQERKQRTEAQWLKYEQEKQAIIALFSQMTDTISAEQQECVNYYWGQVQKKS